MKTIDEMIANSGIRGRLKAAANGMHPLKTDRGDYGILEDALDEINLLRYVLGGVRDAIRTGRNEPLVIWKEQIDIALGEQENG